MFKKALVLLLCLTIALSIATVAGAEGGKLVDSDVTVTIMCAEHANQPFPQDAIVADWIYEATGIQIELMPIPGADYATKYTTMIAADTMPDVIKSINDTNYKTYAVEEAFVALNEYFDTIMPTFGAVAKEDTQMAKMYVNGNLYGIPHMGYVNNTSMGQEPMIRGDILDELNLEMPANFDELLEVLRAFKAAYPQSYPWCIRGGVDNLISISAYMMGTGGGFYFDQDIGEGEWSYGYTNERFLDELQFIATCYAEGILDPDYANSTSAQWQEKCSIGVGLYTFDNPTFNLNYDVAVKVDKPEAYWTYVPVLENWYGESRGLRYVPHWYDSMDVISSSSENIEACIKLYDWLFTEEGRVLTNFGKEDVTYTVDEDGTMRYTDELLAKSKEYSDPWRGTMGAYGFGHLGLAAYVDESTQNPFLSDTARVWYAYWENEEALDDRAVSPVFTDEESETLATLKTDIDTYLKAEIDKYITGQIPVAEFVDVQAKLMELGVQEVIDIYNAAEARM